MAYDFRTLSPLDFEDLTRDLIGAAVGHHIEGFAPGPDGGVDGRFTTLNGTTIIQAKHLVDSGYASLKSKLKAERTKLLSQKFDRYMVATSLKLTVRRKEEIKRVLHPFLRETDDIFDAVALNSLLRKFPRVERSHIKLWLSGAAQLERILRSASHSKAEATKGDIIRKLRVFVPNESLEKARGILESEHVMIISGGPGVGKTTLAEMVVHALIAEGYDLTRIHGLEEGFDSIRDGDRQVFFFDDFLGKVKLGADAVRHKDSLLTEFIRLVRRAPNARFILTTREYIFKQAMEISEHLSDDSLDVLKFVLDVGVYTKPVRARILYNHVRFSTLTWEYVNALVQKNYLKRVISHPAFNPRVVEWMTSKLDTENVSADEYPQAFLNTLDNPNELWRHAFGSHISTRAQDILIVLFFFDGESDVDALRWPYENFHRRYSQELGRQIDVSDFELSLKELEGSFLSIVDGRIMFCNPSVSDFMASYVRAPVLLRALFLTEAPLAWHRQLWEHARDETDFIKKNYGGLWSADLAKRIASAVVDTPISVDVPHSRFVGATVPVRCDLSPWDRISWMLELWLEFGFDEFASAALSLAQMDVTRVSNWRDIHDLGDLVVEVSRDVYRALPVANELKKQLIDLVIEILGSGRVNAEELVRFSKFVEWDFGVFPEVVDEALVEAIGNELDWVGNNIEDIESLSDLELYYNNVRFLAERANADIENLNANFDVQRRILQVNVTQDDEQDEWWAIDADPTMKDEAIKSIFEDLARSLREG